MFSIGSPQHLLKFKNNILYKVLEASEQEQITNYYAPVALEDCLPLIYSTDPLIKEHNKKYANKISEGAVIAFLRSDSEARTSQKITYYYYRYVKALPLPEELETETELVE